MRGDQPSQGRRAQQGDVAAKDDYIAVEITQRAFRLQDCMAGSQLPSLGDATAAVADLLGNRLTVMADHHYGAIRA